MVKIRYLPDFIKDSLVYHELQKHVTKKLNHSLSIEPVKMDDSIKNINDFIKIIEIMDYRKTNKIHLTVFGIFFDILFN